MFGAITSPGYTCRNNHNFLNTKKDSSLKMNGLSLNNCFRYINFLQIGVKALSLMVFKTLVFRQKAQNFVHFRPDDLVQITPACDPNRHQMMYGETLKLT